LTGVCAIAFGVRVFPAAQVVFPAPDEVRLLGVDAYYHFRHAEYAAEAFPNVQRYDRGTHYPHGQRSDAAGLFDLSIAAVALAIDSTVQRETVLRVAAWSAPVLGTLSFLALFGWMRPVLGAWGALLACGLYLLSPSHAFVRTALGFSDHHAAEIALAVLSVWGLAACLRDGLPLRAPKAWLHAFAGAMPMAFFLFTWVGAPVFLAVLAVATGAVAWLQVASAASTRIGSAAFRYALTFAAITWAVSMLSPNLRLMPWLMQELFLASALFAVGPWVFEWVSGAAVRRGASPAATAWVAIALVGIAVVVSLTFAHDAVGYLVIVLAPKTLLVREHHMITPQHYWIQFGPAGVAALAALPISLLAAWRQRDPLAALPALLGLLLLALWVQTRDYGYLMPPFVAALAASTALVAMRRARATRWSVHVGVALLVVLAFPLWPFDGIRRPFFKRSQIEAVRMLDEGWWEAARWLESHARPLPFSLSDPTPRFRKKKQPSTAPIYPPGSYAVLTSWDFGGFVSAIARRPVLWSRGSNNDPTSAWLVGEAGVESFDTVESMCVYCEPHDDVRYVVVGARIGANFLAAKLRQTDRSPDDYYVSDGTIAFRDWEVPHWRNSERYARMMYARLYLEDGRGLSHLRLVHETVHQSALVSQVKLTSDGEPEEYRRRAHPIDSEADRNHWQAAVGFGRVMRLSPRRFAFDAHFASSVKTFERVAGARLVGAAPAGAERVEARLALRARTTGREFEYSTSAPVEDGRYELVLPYSTQPPRGGDVVALGSYRIGFSAGEAERRFVEVGGEAVERGSQIDVSN
jgi:dolichyl-diphosphooligosaccharide--protein glycosyltransferase